MSAPTLQQIETETQLVRELRRAAWSDLRDAFLSPKVCTILPDDSRRVILAAVEGFDRELEALATIKSELLGSGKTAVRTESRFNASVLTSALLSASLACDAQTAPREAPRSDASAATLPAAGEVF